MGQGNEGGGVELLVTVRIVTARGTVDSKGMRGIAEEIETAINQNTIYLASCASKDISTVEARRNVTMSAVVSGDGRVFQVGGNFYPG